jgi:hypothetical protein
MPILWEFIFVAGMGINIDYEQTHDDTTQMSVPKILIVKFFCFLMYEW